MRDRQKGNVCVADGCVRPAAIRGCCPMHYHRLRKHGNPNAGRTPNGLAVTWLREHAEYTGEECLIYPFPRGDDGYGRVTFDQRPKTANYVMCELAHGAPPSEEHESAHSCGNGHLGCVNPQHLRWATHAENLAEMIPHGTSTRGVRNARAKLTDSEIMVIRANRKTHRQSQLAEQFGISQQHVSLIQRGGTWKWLPGGAMQ